MEPVRKINQLLHKTVATSYYNLPHRILRTGDLEPRNNKSLAFAGLQWSRFYSFQGLVRLCKIKNPK